MVKEWPAAWRARHHEIVEHACADDQSLAGSISRQISDALGPGLGRKGRPKPRAAEPHLAGLERRRPSGDLQNALTARALQPGDPDDFSAAKRERARLEMLIGDVVKLQESIGRRLRRAGRKEALRQVPPNHEALDLVTAELVGGVVADLTPVLEDRQAVRDGADLGQVVRDESDNEALSFERPHRFE